MWGALRKWYLYQFLQSIFIHRAAPNSCKAVWKIINSSIGRSSETVKHNLSPDDFNNAFSSSEMAALENIPSSIPCSSQLLHNQDVPSLRFTWSPVTCSETPELPRTGIWQ
ncbi:hypothetical protein J6590_083521 [Homalodisca vitripennis]|nr:hypothetical protein J6590_083521 [Homalodisca vitripennis]